MSRLPRVRYHAERMARDIAIAGLTVPALAKRARVSKRVIWYYLNGSVQTAKTNAKLAKALGTDPARYVVGIER